MNTEWSLTELYTGIDDPAYEADFKKIDELTGQLSELVSAAPERSDKENAESMLAALEAYNEVLYKISLYLGLRQSVDTENGDIMAQSARLLKAMSDGAASLSAISKILAGISDLEALKKESSIAAYYSFYLEENKKEASHLFSDEVEAMIGAMNMTGGAAWSKLQAYLTSTVKVDYDGGVVTLSEIRNLAYSADESVRKAAYEAELAAYEKIEDGVAFSLNNIKNQVNMLAEKRGYESPLAMTLAQSKMKRETLDAMMRAIESYLPTLRNYLKKKGELLGHKNGLPWYDLYAPVGKSNGKKYTIEEAKQYLIDCFSSFSPDMSDLMREAFEESWIDFYPRKGKEGGAFCAGMPDSRKSRILTNFDGNFGAVDTLAHELGHAFHNRQIGEERALYKDYPMPVAETASTFNEVHLGKYACANATGEELLNLLDSDLREQTQCIVDIYSRYLFESAVFEQSKSKFLMAGDLKELMLNAQQAAYGDGLDAQYLHPYMWVCKSHYYSEGLSFYNFPYAFGNLFAIGLYALYRKEGASFVPKYKAMLNATPKCSIEDAGAMVGIDLTDEAFWRDSLAQIAAEIEEFCAAAASGN